MMNETSTLLQNGENKEDQIKLNGQLNHNQLDNHQDNQQQDDKMDFKHNLKLDEEANLDKISNDDNKLNNEFTNGLDNLKEEEEEDNINDKIDEDESSKYESLNNSHQDEESIKETKEEEIKKEVEIKEDEQEQSNEFVELFGNPDLLRRIIKKGDETSLKPERGCECLINLEVKNESTNELIESECQKNFTVIIGDFDVVHGVDLALLKMQKNEISEILLKPLVAYGPLGKQPGVPANCALICKVELLNVVWPNELVCASLDDLNHYFKLTKFKKERGNFFFKRQEFATAFHCYVKSCDFLDFLGQEMVQRHHLLTSSLSRVTNDELRKNEIADELNSINELSVEYMKVKLDVFNNLSAVNIKMKSYNQALEAVDNALRINQDDLKALYRKSMILSHKGCLEEAIATLKRALKLDPKNKTFLNELNILKIRFKKEMREEKALYAKMLQSKKKIKNKKQSTNSQFFFLNYMTAGLLVSGVVLGSFILYKKYANS